MVSATVWPGFVQCLHARTERSAGSQASKIQARRKRQPAHPLRPTMQKFRCNGALDAMYLRLLQHAIARSDTHIGQGRAMGIPPT